MEQKYFKRLVKLNKRKNMDIIGLKLCLLSFLFILMAIAGMKVSARRKKKEIQEDMLNQLTSAAKKLGSIPEQTEVFNGMSLGLDQAKGILFYHGSEDRKVEIIRVSDSVPAKVDITMDSGHIDLILLKVISMNGLPYIIPFYDWFLNEKQTLDECEKKALDWEKKVNHMILDNACRKLPS